MNLVLIGYRGTGKSLAAGLVARQLGLERLSLDEEIVRRVGMAIPQYVEKHGWPAFRDVESAIVEEVSRSDGLVLDTGGGVIERGENVAALRQNGCVVWLKAAVPTIVGRIAGGTDRPALTAGKSFTEEVAEVLTRRNPLYQAAAHFEIDTDTLAPQELAGRIVEIWERQTR
ncbi:MAG: shikimate kinase [Desulfuromonadales bacterium]|nr:shikimate kinase [Desulfuromonadales bacterium]